jgi:hypothetical protein
MMIPTPSQLQDALHVAGLPTPTGRHIVALRKRGGAVDAFDDMLLVVDGATSIALACRCTTDPGKGPRQDPKNPAGCAVWAPGQVVDGLTFGLHHGTYGCLVPCKPIPVDRYDSLTDTTPTRSTSTTTQIHRASATHESSIVGAWSEGCIVVANPADFLKLMDLAHGSGQKRFTVTLLEW